jgi:hypothetical protein
VVQTNLGGHEIMGNPWISRRFSHAKIPAKNQIQNHPPPYPSHDEGMPDVGQQVPLSQGVTHEISTDDPRLHFF